MVDFIEASPLRYALTVKPTIYISHIEQFWSTARIETTKEGTKILATVDGIVRTVSESSLRQNLKLRDEEGINSLSDAELFENLTLMGYNISPNQKFTFQKGQFSHQWKYLIHTIIQCPSPKSTGFNEFSSNIATALGEGSGTPTEPHQTPSPEASSPSHITHTSPSLPPVATTSIPTGRSMDEGEAATERVSDDTEEMATVLTLMDASTVLASGVVDVPTGSRSIPTASIIAEGSVPTSSEEVPTASPVFATATVVTPVTRRKGKEKTSEEVTEEAKPLEEVTKEKVKEMMLLVPIEEVYVEALQVKHPIIDWKVYHEGQRSYWKITRLGGSSASYQFFIDLLKHLDKEDLNQLWRLVKVTLSNRPPTIDWKLYDSCGAHHVTSKDKEIFMLVEKDYPLRKGLALVMICYKLQVENFSQMANDLVLKMYKIANSPRQQGD
nr:xylulose kinase-1 [Tanacetum cinerariifolium]